MTSVFDKLTEAEKREHDLKQFVFHRYRILKQGSAEIFEALNPAFDYTLEEIQNAIAQENKNVR